MLTYELIRADGLAWNCRAATGPVCGVCCDGDDGRTHLSAQGCFQCGVTFHYRCTNETNNYLFYTCAACTAWG